MCTGEGESSQKDTSLQIEEGKCYLVKRVAGGGVLCARAKPDSQFPVMHVSRSINLSSILCQGDGYEMKDHRLNLSFAMECPENVENKCSNEDACRCCKSSVSDQIKKIVQYIERI